MKKTSGIIIGAVALLAIVIFAVRFWSGEKKVTIEEAGTAVAPQVAEGPNIKITSPGANAAVTSPLKITGEAKGWYFEATFPVKLIDDKGNVLAQSQAKATSDWTVDAFVPFELELSFDPVGARSGQIVFEKDNPSGRPENADSFSLPVVFGK